MRVTTGEESFRAFVALMPDEASEARVAAAVERLRATAGELRARYTPRDQLHVTLKFFARLDGAHAAALAAELPAIARSSPPIAARLGALTAFPSVSRANHVVLPIVDENAAVAALADAIASRANPLGYPREDRRFQPHLTLARTKKPVNARAWFASAADGSLASCELVAIVLFKSILGATGAEHIPIARAALGG